MTPRDSDAPRLMERGAPRGATYHPQYTTPSPPTTPSARRVRAPLAGRRRAWAARYRRLPAGYRPRLAALLARAPRLARRAASSSALVAGGAA